MALSGEEDPPDLRDRLCQVGQYSRATRAHEFGLVILSMGIPYWLMPLEEGGYGLFVERQYEAAVREQFAKFEREHRYWPPPQDFLPSATGAGWSIALYALLIWGMFLITDEGLIRAGSASEAAIFEGEGWRVVTALTLHGDWAHLVGNTVGGLLFFGLVFRYLGYGTGWFLILAAGACGNLLNAWGYAGTGHQSIGASTAVFGGLGLVIGFRLFRQFRLTGWQWPRQLLVPLVAGLVLLGFLGAGGERTDVLAHWWGFLSGTLLGAAAAWIQLDERCKKIRCQNLFGWITILIVVGAWFLALR